MPISPLSTHTMAPPFPMGVVEPAAACPGGGLARSAAGRATPPPLSMIRGGLTRLRYHRSASIAAAVATIVAASVVPTISAGCAEPYVIRMAISVVGVLIFAGLTAYDTQKIKSMYFYVRGTDFVGKSVIMGALNLYLDFINMFLFLLRFLGNRN